MNEDIVQCLDVEFVQDNKGHINEKIERPATYCMICQSVVHEVYILDHGVHHCLMCVETDEVDSITTAKCKHEKREPEKGELQKSYAAFRKIALLEPDIHNVKATQHNQIKCTHGKWNEDRTTWKWEEKWFCNLCPKSFKDVPIEKDPNKNLRPAYQKKREELTKNKTEHEVYHKDAQLKKQSRDKTQPIEKVVWVLEEDRVENKRSVPKFSNVSLSEFQDLITKKG